VLYSSFLLNSHDVLLGKIWLVLKCFDSLFTNRYGDHLMLEGIECTVAWYSVDNWQPLIYDVYFYRELKKSNEEKQVVLFKDKPHYVNFLY